MSGFESDDPIPESDNWAIAYSKILSLAAKLGYRIAASPIAKSPSSPADMATKNLRRAVRMSTVTRLVFRALLSGTLVPEEHLHLSVKPGAMHVYPTMWGAVSDVLDAIETGRPMAKAQRELREGFWCLKEEGLGVMLNVFKVYREAAAGRASTEARKRWRVSGAEERDGWKKREVDIGGSSSCGGDGGGGMGEDVEKGVGA